jgi:hypothetical protein
MTAPEPTDTQAQALQAIIDRAAARRAADAHGDLFAALQATQAALNRANREITRITGELVEVAAERDQQRAEIARLHRVITPPPPEAPPQPTPVQCPQCHMVVALVGAGRTDTVPERCPKCYTTLGDAPAFPHTIPAEEVR